MAAGAQSERMGGMTSRPNILLIMSDEHDAAVTGCYGDPVVRTPNLDRLAGEGVLFDSCYTTSPLCVPARLSFTACQYVSRCKGWSNNNCLASDDGPSIARVLNAAGYESLLAGKMHYAQDHRYGFRDLFDSPYNRARHLGAVPHAPRDPGDLTPSPEAWEQRARDFRVSESSALLERDRQVTEVCSEFLQGRKPSDAPFFLLAGYLAPHFPLIVPEEYVAPYRGRVPMPEIPEGLIESLPRNYQHLRAGFGITEASPEEEGRGRELYWGLTEWFDHEVGKLLAALRDSEVADETIVIYTSDHGENKGDHGLWWKNNFYEHSGRIPLIVSWPARWAGGQRRTEACSLVDLVQTVTDLAGAEPDAGWDGDSMVPWLDDAAAGWKDFALSEYYGHNICSGMTMWREGEWKYIYHNSAGTGFPPERELYNLREDPGEFRNRASEPEQQARIAAMHAAMVRELGRDPEEVEREWLALSRVTRPPFAQG